MQVNMPLAATARKNSNPCSFESRPPSKSLILRSSIRKNHATAAIATEMPSPRAIRGFLNTSSPRNPADGRRSLHHAQARDKHHQKVINCEGEHRLLQKSLPPQSGKVRLGVNMIIYRP